MNLGLVTSFIIGGLLLLSILTVNFRVSHSSAELTLSGNVKQHASAIADMVSHDVSKVGYNWMGKINNPIITADSNKFVFKVNIDNDNSNTVEQVTWEFGTAALTSTPNPNDMILNRMVTRDGTSVSNTDIKLGVTEFTVRYYSDVGSNTPMSTPVANPENIRQVEIDLKVETKQKFYTSSSSNGRFIVSSWQKRFSPINIQN
ncbi:MAG: hypothetical protein U5K69_16665 [Balneolaceae bacterium]|nr:hypothetical protein [Balneolaceae bacterium]